MTMKNDAKFEEELACRLEIQMRNFTIWREYSSLKKLAL